MAVSLEKKDLAFDPKTVEGSDNFVEREFPMTRADFRKISQLSYSMSGIVLSDAKQEMVYSRIARRVRALNMRTFSEYLTFLEKGSGGKEEEEHFLNAITTNLTSFFRESHHFKYLKEVAIPQLMEAHRVDKRIRVWCCAASTGEEPYSIAMTFREAISDIDRWDVKILATDIDSDVLARAGLRDLRAGRGNCCDGCDCQPDQHRRPPLRREQRHGGPLIRSLGARRWGWPG